MGFKRTTEGRVFFHNSDTDSMGNVINRPLTQPAAMKSASADKAAVAPKAADNTQAQIITLLKSLNTKLQSTQADREKLQSELETYKAMVLSLQDKTKTFEDETKDIRKRLDVSGANAKKTEQAEQMSREALKEFEETRRLIAEIEEKAERTEALLKKQQVKSRQSEEQARIKWETLEKNQKKQSQEILSRLNKNEDAQKQLGHRVEESMNAAMKIERKIEKAVQDRSRLLRKLERIEETVLQTNEALNARAMVLLTDQNTANGSGYPNAPALGDHGDDSLHNGAVADEEAALAPWWQKPMQMRATSVSLIVLGAVLAGWAVSNIQKPNGFDFFVEMPPVTSFSERVQANQDLSVPPVNNDMVAEADMTAEVVTAPGGSDVSALEPEQNGLAEQVEMSDAEAQAFDQVIEQQQQEQLAHNDINAIDLNDEEALLAALENDPDALAARLNEIEPSALTEEEATLSEPLQTETTQEIRTSVVQDRSGEARALKTELQNISLPSELAGPISSHIKPDGSLPDNIKEIENAAFQGSAEAQHDLAAIYVAGHGGVEQDFQRASKWFEQAAHRGIANARYNLGVLYHQGIGVDQDIDKAFTWYKTAAALGHPEAEYNLGIAYIEGIGVSYDPQKAALYFENAANGGVMEAAYNLGLIYENGLLGKAQPDTALMWYKNAADQGSPEAKSALQQLAKTLGMSINDVNKLIDGMKVLNTAAAQKKTEKLGAARDHSAVNAINSAGRIERETSAKPVPEDNQRSLIAKVQEQLMELGLYPGPVDGVDGMMTSDAVRSYQSRNNLSVDGKITPELLSHMRFQDIGSGEGVLEQGSREY